MYLSNNIEATQDELRDLINLAELATSNAGGSRSAEIALIAMVSWLRRHNISGCDQEYCLGVAERYLSSDFILKTSESSKNRMELSIAYGDPDHKV